MALIKYNSTKNGTGQLNRRKLLSLFLSILIHLTIFSLLWYILHHEKRLLTSSGAKKVEISLKDFITTPPGAEKKKSRPKPPTPPLPPKPPAKPQPKPKAQAKPKPKPQPKPKPKIIPKPTPKNPPQPRPKPTPKKKTKKAIRQVSKPHKKAIRPKPTPPKHRYAKSKPTPPANALSQLAGALGAPAMPSRSSRPKPPSIDQINGAMGEREFRALYKDEFDHFTPTQRRFIRNNLNRIQAITQHYLTMRGYPPFAVEERMQGVNVVEFYLWPNGDITDLKVISSSGYAVLDDNSLDTIRTAYKDYPRPKEKTKIRFYIHYQLIF